MELSVGEATSAGFEALSVLRAAALRTAGPLAAQLAERALRITERGDFAVAQDALQALLRRVAAARGAGAVLARPRRRAVGWYRVARRGDDSLHHDVLLSSIDPIEGSCSCPDYAKASLGLCKHIFLVAAGRTKAESLARPPLRWDPVRPLVGAGDWLERLTWSGDELLTGRPARVRRLFRGRAGEAAALPASLRAHPPARLAAIDALLEIVRSDERLAEPAIRALLENERGRLAQRVRGAFPAREIRRHCETLRQTLFLYQREGVRRFLERGRLLLADDMGLGKTAQAIAACHVLVRSGRARRGLVIVPAPLKPQWAREWRRFTDIPLTVVEGDAEERAHTVRRSRTGVLLVNYEQVIRDLPSLLRFRPDVVVLDEAQRIKNWATRTASCVKQIEAPWRLVLTGTPMENRLEELASIMEWIDESALEPRWRLASWHSVAGEDRRGAVGARNLDTLRQRLAPSMMRRVRRDVLEQLPPRRDTCIAVPLTSAQQGAHDELMPAIARMAAQAARRPLTQPEFMRLMTLLTRQRIVCNGLAQADFLEVWPGIERRRPTAALLDSLASPKLTELRELISAIAITQERKVVVFSQWTRMLKLATWAVSDLLQAAGVRAVHFSGEEGARRRTENLVALHDDPEVRVLFASDAGGVGLNLQQAASCCIHIDLPWNPAVLEQRVGRIHRLGQEHPVETYALVADNGIEGRIATLVEGKQALFTELFDGTSDSVAFERSASFLSRLETLVGAAPAVPRDDIDLIDGSPTEDVGAEEPVEVAGGSPLVAGGDARADAVGSLLSQIQVTRQADGRVAFEAPAPAAAALAELFQAVARLLTPAEADRGEAM
jgi:superfamily II DNA or RNA helicase